MTTLLQLGVCYKSKLYLGHIFLTEETKDLNEN